MLVRELEMDPAPPLSHRQRREREDKGDALFTFLT